MKPPSADGLRCRRIASGDVVLVRGRLSTPIPGNHQADSAHGRRFEAPAPSNTNLLILLARSMGLIPASPP
jgi:hypothetical protein